MCNAFNKKFLDEAAKKQPHEEATPDTHEASMNEAIQAAIQGLNNRVTSTNDPTAHAEIVAIKEACKTLNDFQLEDCIIYTSCEPCPMCLGAIYWARPKKVFYGCKKQDAAAIGFEDAFIYKEIVLPDEKRSIPFEQCAQEKALEPFQKWSAKEDKIAY